MSEKYVKLADVEAHLERHLDPVWTDCPRCRETPESDGGVCAHCTAIGAAWDLDALPAVDLAERLARRDRLWREFVYVRHVKVPATAAEMTAARAALLADGAQVDG